MTPLFTEIVETVLARAPQWIRHDLSAKDPAVRARAEEALAAMIAGALAEAEARADASA